MHRAMLIWILLPPGSVVMSMVHISTEVIETILCWASHTLHWPWDAVTGPVTPAGYCSRRDDPAHLGRAHSLIGKDGPNSHHSCVPHWGRILELIQLSQTWENKRCPPHLPCGDTGKGKMSSLLCPLLPVAGERPPLGHTSYSTQESMSCTPPGQHSRADPIVGEAELSQT